MGIFKSIIGIGKAVNKGIDELSGKVKNEEKKITSNYSGESVVKQYKFYTAYGKPGTKNYKEMQKQLKSIVPKSANFKKSSKELLKMGIQTVHEFELEGSGVHFIEEPDNKYDSEAVRIEIDGIGDVGYVPKKKQRTVKSYRFGGRKDSLIGVRYLLFGGDTRYVGDELYSDIDDDDDNDQMTKDYSIRIIFDYKA